MYRYIKAFMDFLICLVALPVFGLIYIFAAIAIKAEDGGPVFYKAPRLGIGGKHIYMYKFRSMRVNAPNIVNADGNTYNAEDDPRVTKIGKFLRETSLDETAQILNVLRGEMSIIGPRASEWETLPTYQEDELDKLKVKPGITGYTQAYYRNSLSAREKRLYDAWYANHVSLWLDIKILFKTVAVVLKRENIYSNPTPQEAAEKSEELESTNR